MNKKKKKKKKKKTLKSKKYTNVFIFTYDVGKKVSLCNTGHFEHFVHFVHIGHNHVCKHRAIVVGMVFARQFLCQHDWHDFCLAIFIPFCVGTIPAYATCVPLKTNFIGPILASLLAAIQTSLG